MSLATAARAELARRVLDRRRAQADPAYLLSFMSAPDERTGETFTFGHCRSDEEAAASGWGWQRGFFLWLYNQHRSITLKARQLGVTWLGCGACVVDALRLPGSLILIYRQKEEEAIENVRRCWSLFESLPEWLRMGVEVITPARGALPSTEIKLRHPNGRISRIVAMTSASASGHGKTARRVLLDEHSRIDRAEEIMKAVQPAAGSKGHISIISTANGVSDPESGAGNQFHWLWVNAEDAGFATRFLPWSMHPDRDQSWYDNDPEIRGMKTWERAEQYPTNEEEAFTLTNRVWFEKDDLEHYAGLVPEPLYRFDYIDPVSRGLVLGPRAVVRKHDRGMIRVYVEPERGHKYAIGADVAEGRRVDYSAAYVIDLSTMAFVAELHGRLGEDLYAAQLHYLGRWYGRASTDDETGFAFLAVETGGGFGNAVIAALRDQTKGRPSYTNLYQHILENRREKPIAKPFGFPMNTATRPKAIGQLDAALRERTIPWLTHQQMGEARTFVAHDTGPSPRAQKGCRDDAIIATCIALELYRLRGTHAARRKRKSTRRRETARPWQEAAA